jgi:hypothetical protein
MKNILILTSSGGGGLIQAAKAKEQEILKANPGARCYTIDLLKEATWFNMGHFFIYLYNSSQKKGAIGIQEKLVGCLGAAEVILWPAIFLSVHKALKEYDIDHVIDTQCLNSTSIVKAVRLYNKKNHKNVVVEKVLVDLPTNLSFHFFHSIKKLSKNDRKIFRLIALEPLCEPNQTEMQFWLKYYHLDPQQIIYEKYPIREAFKEYMTKKREGSEKTIQIRTSDDLEKESIRSCVQKSNVSFTETQEGFQFHFNPQDKIVVIILGSQPSKKGTYSYIEKWIEIFKKKDFSENVSVFVYCPLSVFDQVVSLVKKEKEFPANLTIVPMGFQKEDVIASLFFFNDWSITRSGGQTAMELMALSKGKVWIHSESPDLDPKNLPKLLKGIPAWEKGNAIYLKEKFQAGIMTPNLMDYYINTL